MGGGAGAAPGRRRAPGRVAPAPRVGDPWALPVDRLRGVGPARTAALERRGIRTLIDLLFTLIEAIRAVHAGESALHPVIARKVIDHFTRQAGHPDEQSESAQLSDRELEVLRLAAKGMSNRDIARDLNLSQRTIQAHLSTIFTKMEVGSRTEAVVQALREGWLTLDETL